MLGQVDADRERTGYYGRHWEQQVHLSLPKLHLLATLQVVHCDSLPLPGQGHPVGILVLLPTVSGWIAAVPRGGLLAQLCTRGKPSKQIQSLALRKQGDGSVAQGQGGLSV